MKKQKLLMIVCGILVIAIIGLVILGNYYRKNQINESYDDRIEQIDIDTIYLTDTGVQVDFSEVIVGNNEEIRKLIVNTQEITVSTELTDNLIKKLDFEILKKSQKVSYAGTGYFVVDLDNLTKNDVIQDKKSKTITIVIDHAYLQTIEINPDKIMIDEVKEGLLARGDIKLTVREYNSIEKELRKRMEEELNTVENAQKADTVAIQMVKEIYEPLVKAVNSSYKLEVKFK